MTHRLNQCSGQLGVFNLTTLKFKPKNEVCTQSSNQGIFLRFRKIFVNGGPKLLELVAVAVGPDFDFFFVYIVISDSLQGKRTCSHLEQVLVHTCSHFSGSTQALKFFKNLASKTQVFEKEIIKHSNLSINSQENHD